ncbi:MAG: ribosome biogenesis GTPase Der [Alphaproteobacteria bacterium]|nr:ribosome biogenesis GTPase Der [Alphaproteobacteria bacterium]
MTLSVAIIGRPNVGKSTLFNRLVGKRLALVDDAPGVTRDRREGEARLGDLVFRVIDTAGLDDAKGEELPEQIQAQTDRAIASAGLCLFLIDARAGVTPYDREIAQRLRRGGGRVIVAANKCEGTAAMAGAAEAHALGFGEPIELSAEHGIGLDDLYRALHDLVEEKESAAGEGEEDAARPIQIAFVGRPNAGKSTLINALLGEERLVTSGVAGTTRDAIAVTLDWEGRAFRIFDTAGLRRKARVSEKVEKLAVADALRAVRFGEVVILTMDEANAFEQQDLAIADLIAREGRAVVFAITKWDLVESPQARRKALERLATEALPQLRGAPLVTVSGLTPTGLDRLMRAILTAHETWATRVPTAALNRFLAAMLEKNPPPAVRGRRIKLRYMTQAKARPPTFALFGNQLDSLPESYLRFLTNGLRDSFALAGVPIRITLKASKNPYAEKE